MTERSRRLRIVRALVLGIVVLVGLFSWDSSRQPTSGANWELLAARRVTGRPWSVHVITAHADLAAAWDEFRLQGDPSRIDLGATAVVWFANFGTQGCPSRLDGLQIDVAGRLVTGHFSRGLVAGCDDREVADSFLVLIQRSRLPPSPFRIEMADPYAPGPPRPGVDVP